MLIILENLTESLNVRAQSHNKERDIVVLVFEGTEVDSDHAKKDTSMQDRTPMERTGMNGTLCRAGAR